MGHIGIFVLAAISFVGVTNGMDCSFGTSKNPFEKFVQTCPRVLIDSQTASYCCLNLSFDGGLHCCEAWEFFGVIIFAICLLMLIVDCLRRCCC